MDSFLRQIAYRIATEHPQDTDRVLVVFNNHRSLRFFQRQFVGIGRTMFLPRTMAIDDLVAQLGGLQIVPPEFLLFELYTIHIELEGEERKYKTFDEFIAFGDLMVADFSELDQYCVDVRDIFGNLHDIKAIGEWDIEGSELTEFQRQYLHFYRSLYEYYRRLHERLLTQGKAYSGMAYRNVAEHIGEWADKVDADTIYFVGFNALSECERLIIGEFVHRGKGHLLSDGDPYFLSEEQESGRFIRKHQAEFPEIKPKGTSLFAQQHKQITIVECPENLLQCKYVGQLMEDHPEWLLKGKQERTAIVLADEGLLLPMLNSLPEGNYGVNISMGYAFSDSNMHLLAQRLLALHATGSPLGYHHSAIVDLLSDHYVQQLLGGGTLHSHIANWLTRENIIRCSGKEIRQQVGNTPTASLLFPDSPLDVDPWLDNLQALIGLIAESGLLERNKKEQQAAGSLAEVATYLSELQHHYQYITSLDTLRKIYLRIAQRHQVALIGEPLSGLQVMGMLETRNLDFDRVVLLSAGEGMLPASRSTSSLIPYQLKVDFHLPTYHEKDSVYAFNFYHLLLRAQEVYLVYSSQSEAMGKGEPSRFILQVERELAPRFGYDVRHVVVNNSEPARQPVATTNEPIAKSDEVIAKLRHIANEGFTPTGFEDYLQCPLRYYYSRLLGIRRQESLEEDLDASQLGTCIHNVLQTMYEPLIGKPLTAEALHHCLEHLTETMDEAFQSLFRHGRSTEGRNHFYHAVAETQLRTLLRHEIDLLEHGHTIEIISVEQTYGPLQIATTPQGEPIRLRGKVDRVDRLDGNLRIIDYKTGSVKPEELTSSTTSNRNGEIAIPGKWFQLMCYGLLYAESISTHEDMQVGIYPLRNMQTGIRLASCDGRNVLHAEDFLNFRHRLAETCRLLLCPEEPFRPTERPSDCSYCDVRTFCPHRPKTLMTKKDNK